MLHSNATYRMYTFMKPLTMLYHFRVSQLRTLCIFPRVISSSGVIAGYKRKTMHSVFPVYFVILSFDKVDASDRNRHTAKY